MKEKLNKIQADIRNKLNPLNNLNQMVEEYFINGRVELKELILSEIKQSKISIEYLSNFISKN